MIYEHSSYRTFLKSVLVERIQKNSAYSLRSMAKSIEVAPSQLSDVFKGSKNLSLQNSLRVAAKLGLDPREREYFSLLVQYEITNVTEVRQMILDRLRSMSTVREFVALDLDILKIASEWYHIPIMVLAETPKFKGEPKVIAKKLGISTVEAELAVERLIRTEILIRNADKTLTVKNLKGLFQTEEANTGLRAFHKRMLEKAIESVDSQSNAEKFVGSETFLFDERQLKKFRLVVEDFFTQACKVSDSGKIRDQVYHLGVQFFRVTHKDQKS